MAVKIRFRETLGKDLVIVIIIDGRDPQIAIDRAAKHCQPKGVADHVVSKDAVGNHRHLIHL